MHVPQMSSLKIVLLSFVLLVSAARAATTIQSFTVTGNVVGNSDVSATGMVTINRDPTDTGMESVILGQGFPNVQVTCADGGSANACNIPAGSSVTTFQMKAPNTRDTSTTVTLGITVASSNASASLTINAATYCAADQPEHGRWAKHARRDDHCDAESSRHCRGAAFDCRFQRKLRELSRHSILAYHSRRRNAGVIPGRQSGVGVVANHNQRMRAG